MSGDYLDGITECPECSGELWDNRKKNAERRATGDKPMPDLVCKDKEGCGWKKWPPKVASPRPAAKPQAARASYTLPQLGALYDQCLCKAVAVVDRRIPKDVVAKNASTSDYIAATATIFIQACRDGVKPITDE